MIKKALATATAALVCIFAVNATDLSERERPQVEFVKDGMVIEKREMTYDEFEAYHQIHKLEKKIDKMESPLEAIEEQIEAQAERVEEAIEVIVENALYSRGDVEHAREIAHHKSDAVIEIKSLVSQMQPAMAQLKGVVNEIKVAAKTFTTTVMQNYNDEQVDYIRVIDQNGRHKIRINDMDFAEHMDIDVDFDIDFDF